MKLEISAKLASELQGYIEQAVQSGRFADEEAVIRCALELLRRNEKSQEAPQKRSGGQWHGQVVIGQDFDDLPPDVAESFGVQ